MASPHIASQHPYSVSLAALLLQWPLPVPPVAMQRILTYLPPALVLQITLAQCNGVVLIASA